MYILDILCQFCLEWILSWHLYIYIYIYIYIYNEIVVCLCLLIVYIYTFIAHNLQLITSESVCEFYYMSVYILHVQWAQPCSHPPPSHQEQLHLHQWVSPGLKCRMLQDTIWATRDRTLELPQWWHHSMRELWEGSTLVSHWVVWNQEQPTGSECGLQMGHQSVVGQGRWMWQQWKVVRSLWESLWVRCLTCTEPSIS